MRCHADRPTPLRVPIPAVSAHRAHLLLLSWPLGTSRSSHGNHKTRSLVDGEPRAPTAPRWPSPLRQYGRSAPSLPKCGWHTSDPPNKPLGRVERAHATARDTVGHGRIDSFVGVAQQTCADPIRSEVEIGMVVEVPDRAAFGSAVIGRPVVGQILLRPLAHQLSAPRNPALSARVKLLPGAREKVVIFHFSMAVAQSPVTIFQIKNRRLIFSNIGSTMVLLAFESRQLMCDCSLE